MHEMSNPVFWKKNKKNIHLWSSEFAQRMVQVKDNACIEIMTLISATLA